MRTIMAVLCALAGWAFVPVSVSHACVNVVLLELDAWTRRVAHAEEQLVRGNFSGGFTEAARALRALRRGEVNASEARAHSALVRRAEKLVALGTVRLGGQVRRASGRPVRVGAAERDANLRWAVRVLDPRGRDEPRAIAWYAEALATDPSRRPEALSMLQDLASRGLLPEAQSHRILAELADAAGDRRTRDSSVAACHRLAGVDASYVCPRLVAVARVR